jgi:hypothetical protein
MTWRGHSCLRRRDSSRRSGTVDAAREEGRDESRPSRQECLRHENGLIPNSTTSGVLNLGPRLEWDRAKASTACPHLRAHCKFHDIRSSAILPEAGVRQYLAGARQQHRDPAVPEAALPNLPTQPGVAPGEPYVPLRPLCRASPASGWPDRHPVATGVPIPPSFVEHFTSAGSDA